MIGLDRVTAISDFIRWITVPFPKPDGDGGLRTFHNKPATSISVEGGAVRVRAGILDTTPRIATSKSAAIPRRRDTSMRAIRRHGTIGKCVERHAVRARVIHTLDDVDFAFVRPVSQARLPDRRPCAAAFWHMPHIEAVCS